MTPLIKLTNFAHEPIYINADYIVALFPCEDEYHSPAPTQIRLNDGGAITVLEESDEIIRKIYKINRLMSKR